MPEGMNMGPSPEELKRLAIEQQARDDAEWEADYFARHQKQPAALREASSEEIAEIEGMVSAFEATHSIEKLLQIGDISPKLSRLFRLTYDLEDPKRVENDIACFKKYNLEQALVYEREIAELKALVLLPEDKAKFEMRRSAKKDLKAITDKFDALTKQTNSSPKREELKVKCERLMKVFGNIDDFKNPNKVDHS